MWRRHRSLRGWKLRLNDSYSDRASRIIYLVWKALGITQKELARKVGCSQGVVSSVLKGRSLSRDTISRLFEVLGLDPGYVKDSSVSPFGSGNFFLMFFKEKYISLDFLISVAIVAEIVEYMGDVEVIFFVLKDWVYGQKRRLVQAILFRDRFDNLFLFRGKIANIYFTAELDLRAYLGKMIRERNCAVRFGSVRISWDLLQKIKDLTVCREDVEGFFDILHEDSRSETSVYPNDGKSLIFIKRFMRDLGLDFRDVADLFGQQDTD